MSGMTETELKTSMLGLLARREYSRSELEKRYGGGALVEKVLDELVKEQLQSDQRFAASLVRSRVEKGYGLLKIQQEARNRGIDSDLLQQTVEQLQPDWVELAAKAYRKKFAAPLNQDDKKDYEKRVRFLLGRGYHFDQVRIAIDQSEEG